MKRPDTHICNIMMGTMYIEHVGEMSVTNHTTGEVTAVKFFEEGWGGKNKQYIEGFVYPNADLAKKGKSSDQTMKVFGKWTETISCVRMQNGKATGEEKVIWKAAAELPKAN